MKALTKCSFKRFFPLIMAIGLVTTFSSCGDDDDTVPVYSLKDVDGSYAGKMLTLATDEPQDAATDEPQGIDVTSKVRNDSVIVEKFPVTDLIKSILGESDATDAIITAIGDVTYKVNYQAALNSKNDSIYLQLKPEPLEIKFEIPAAAEGAEPTKMDVIVTIAAVEKGNFAYKGKKLKFSLQASEITVNTEPFPAFPATTFKFELDKK